MLHPSLFHQILFCRWAYHLRRSTNSRFVGFVYPWQKIQAADLILGANFDGYDLEIPSGCATPGLECVAAFRSFIRIQRAYADWCDHTNTNAPDPIRTPQLSVFGRD